MSFRMGLETFVSGTIGSVIVLPVLFVLYVLNQVVRFFLKILLSFRYGNTLTLNSTGYDGMYMYEGHVNGKRNVLYLATLNLPQDSLSFDIEKHRENYMKYILEKEEYSKLRSIWVTKWGYHCLFKPPQFNIEKHIKLWDDNSVVTEGELMQNILPKLSKDFDNSKPQWEDIVIPRFVYDNEPNNVKCVRILRIHHGYMDGVSNLILLAHTQSGVTLDKFPWVIDPLRKVELVGVTSKVKTILFKIYCFLNLSGACVKSLLHSPKWLQGRWYVKEFSGETLHGWTEGIDVKDVQNIKEQTGCSISSILATILTSSLRNLELKFEDKPPLDEIVVGLVAALLPYPDVTLRNNHCIIKCHLDTRDLPRRARLWSIHQEMKRLSTLPDIYLNHLLPRIFGEMPALFSDSCTSFIAGGGVISNFPASKSKINLWGLEVQDMAGWVPLLTPAGFGCVTLRYGDKLRFCLNADEASMSQKEMDFLLQQIPQEAKLLAKEMGARGPSRGSLVGRFLVNKVDPQVIQVPQEVLQAIIEPEPEVLPQVNNKCQPSGLLRKRRSISFCHRKSLRRDLKLSSREFRLSAALDKVISTVNKFKRNELKN